MSDEFICPDCGGVIGATEVTEAGRPCTCLTGGDAEGNSSSDTAVFQSAPAVKVSDKVCWKCGTDVAGKKRLKDANGYWCMECHQIDLARKGKFKPGVTCPDCGKSFEPERMIDHAGKQLCKPCYSNRIHVDEDDEDDGGRGFGGKPRKKKRSYDSRSSGMDDTTKSRIKYGVVALFVLGLLSAWNFGVFDIGGDNPNSELNQLMGNVKFMLVFALGCIAVLVWWIKRQV